MASNIHAHQHLIGPVLVAGRAHAENGVPSPQIFISNHWVWLTSKALSMTRVNGLPLTPTCLSLHYGIDQSCPWVWSTHGLGWVGLCCVGSWVGIFLSKSLSRCIVVYYWQLSCLLTGVLVTVMMFVWNNVPVHDGLLLVVWSSIGLWVVLVCGSKVFTLRWVGLEKLDPWTTLEWANRAVLPLFPGQSAAEHHYTLAAMAGTYYSSGLSRVRYRERKCAENYNK